MRSDDLIHSIYPWEILAASIVNFLTGKDIEISPSEFNEIVAIIPLKMVESKE